MTSQERLGRSSLLKEIEREIYCLRTNKVGNSIMNASMNFVKLMKLVDNSLLSTPPQQNKVV